MIDMLKESKKLISLTHMGFKYIENIIISDAERLFSDKKTQIKENN